MNRKSIACLIFDGFQSLDVFGPLDVFTEANALLAADDGYDICVVAGSLAPVTASNGVRIAPDRTFDAALEAFHTVIVAGGPDVPFDAPSPAMLSWLQTASTMSRRCCSICTGAFILGHAGLLAGRTATTHWQHAERFRVTFPETTLDPDRIYARDGKLVTSAGVTAGIDLTLALVREDHGAEIALKVAKRLLVIAQRQGGQSQFSPLLTPLPAESSPIAKAINFIHGHLNRRLENGVLAEVACMSVRNFGRAFQKEMGITPAQYVERQRIELAKSQLETSGKTIKQICFDCGFGSAENMRMAFLRNINNTPARYREQFSFEKS